MTEEPNASGKRAAKNTLLLYMRMLVILGIGLFSSRIVLNSLGVDDYGIYNVVGGIVVLLSFLNNAMAGATQRFLNVALGKRNRDEVCQVVNNALILHFCVALVCVLFAESVGLWFLNSKMVIPEARIFAANVVYQFSVMAFALSIIVVPFNSCIIAHEKMSAFAWITIFDVLMKLVVICSLSFASMDKLILYAILLFIQTCLTQVIFIVYCKRKFEECRRIKLRVDKPVMKSMFSFSSWTILGNLGYLIHTQGIGIVINLFFGVSVNAAQGVANQVNGYVKQFVSNFLLAFNPQVVKTYAANEIAEMHVLVVRGCKIACLLVAFFVVPLILEAPTILKLWLGFVPDYAVVFVRLVLALTFFDSFSTLLAAAKGATGDIRNYQIVLTLIGLTHLPLVWGCFKLGWEPYWAQIVYLVLIIILQIVRIWFVCKAINLSISSFYRNVVLRCGLTVLLASCVPAIIHLKLETGVLTSVVVVVTNIVFLSIFSVFIAFSREERVVVLDMFLKKIKKGKNRR